MTWHGEEVSSLACGYSARADGALCGVEATHHLLFPDGETGAACTVHFWLAFDKDTLADAHPITFACHMGGAEWVYTTADGWGRCKLRDDLAEMEVATSTEVLA